MSLCCWCFLHGSAEARAQASLSGSPLASVSANVPMAGAARVLLDIPWHHAGSPMRCQGETWSTLKSLACQACQREPGLVRHPRPPQVGPGQLASHGGAAADLLHAGLLQHARQPTAQHVVTCRSMACTSIHRPSNCYFTDACVPAEEPQPKQPRMDTMPGQGPPGYQGGYGMPGQ